jgi:hypothetical protein
VSEVRQLKINLLEQLNELTISGAQFDWANSTGEKYTQFGVSHPAPACFISYKQISKRSSEKELKQKWRITRSEEYRDKTIQLSFRDRCRSFSVLNRTQGRSIAFV